MITYPLKSLHPTWPYITDVEDLETLDEAGYTGPVMMPIGVYRAQDQYIEAFLPRALDENKQYPIGALLTVERTRQGRF